MALKSFFFFFRQLFDQIHVMSIQAERLGYLENDNWTNSYSAKLLLTKQEQLEFRTWEVHVAALNDSRIPEIDWHILVKLVKQVLEVILVGGSPIKRYPLRLVILRVTQTIMQQTIILRQLYCSTKNCRYLWLHGAYRYWYCLLIISNIVYEILTSFLNQTS